ncbi:MAG: ROK family protein [Pseudomonadota bacterium]
MTRLGLDIGGTKIEAALLTPDGTVAARERVAMPHIYGDVLAVIADLVDRVERMAGVTSASAGVGTPGSLSPVTGKMRNAFSTPFNDKPLDVDLARVLDRPVRLANDANCFALAEARAGAAKDASVVFGAILGTGIGGGIVVNGEPLIGHNGIGSEWGHNLLPGEKAAEHDPPVCTCGRAGDIEAWCSGPGLSRDHFRRTGSDLDPAMIAAFADAGDLEAKETLDLHAQRLGRALAGVVNLLDPDAIVLGGGLSNMAHLYDELPEAIRAHVFSDTFTTPIRKNVLGDSAGVIGAAWLCPLEG